jgi:hypothetical protein
MASEADMKALGTLLGENEESKTEARAHLEHRLDQLKILEEANVHLGLFVTRSKRRIEDEEGVLFFVTGEIAIQRPSDARWLRTHIGNAFVDEKTFNRLVLDQPCHLFLNLDKVEP